MLYDSSRRPPMRINDAIQWGRPHCLSSEDMHRPTMLLLWVWFFSVVGVLYDGCFVCTQHTTHAYDRPDLAPTPCVLPGPHAFSRGCCRVQDGADPNRPHFPALHGERQIYLCASLADLVSAEFMEGSQRLRRESTHARLRCGEHDAVIERGRGRDTRCTAQFALMFVGGCKTFRDAADFVDEGGLGRGTGGGGGDHVSSCGPAS